MELNPNHPVTQTLSDHWHKMLALVMHKLGETHLVITLDDIRYIQAMHANQFIVVQELDDGLHVKFVDEETAHRLARESGGLPT